MTSLRSTRLQAMLAACSLITIVSVAHHLLAGKADQPASSQSSVNCPQQQSSAAHETVAKIAKDVQLPTVCYDLTCKSAYMKHLQTDGTTYPIPAIRHLLWRNGSVSAHFANQLRTWKKLHPSWTVILWRDEDMKQFVRKHFPAALTRYLKLAPHPIMQLDMFRFFLLFKYGGVYADLDYSLASSLDPYRRFHAIVTREPEAHSLQFWGLRWPVRPMASPAFMMSAPGHIFYRYCIEKLMTMPFMKGRPLSFAGPFGLTQILESYGTTFPVANNPMETVYMPPSYSFHPYANNLLNSTKSVYLRQRLGAIKFSCKSLSNDSAIELLRYCKDVNNMDPITDRTQPIVAIHDMTKTGAIYDGTGAKFYLKNLVNVKTIFEDLQLGQAWI